MNEAIHHSSKVGVATCTHFHHEEPAPDEQDVMVAVEERRLLIFLADDHEDGIKQLHILVVVVQPHQETDLHTSGASYLGMIAPQRAVVWIVVHLRQHSHYAYEVHDALIDIIPKHIRSDGHGLVVGHNMLAKEDH